MKKGPTLFLVGLAVTLLIAMFVSRYASSQPDGLNHVAEQHGFIENEQPHALDDWPLAGYGGGSGTGLVIAGLVGVLATLGLGFGVFWLVRSKQDPDDR